MHKFKKYSSYKDSGIEWLGKIPEHWEVKRLGTLGRFSASGIDKHINKNESLVKIINFTDIYSNTRHILDNSIQYMEVTTPENNRIKHLVQKGDLIFLPSSETYEDLGLAALVNEELDNTSFSYHVIRLQFKKDIEHHFKKYLTNNNFVLNQFSSYGKGTTRKIIGRNVFKNVKVIIPPKEEQIKIASFLDEKTSQIDKAISQKEKLIELLKEYRQIIINEAVTKGLNKNVEFKDSGVEWIGKIPKHWEVKKLKNIFKFNKGLTITRENLQDEGVFCVNYGEIHSKYGFEVNPQIHSLKCVSESYLEKNRGSLLKNGDFIFADTSEDIEGSGNFTYLNSDLQTFAGYHTIICRSKNDIFSRFFAYEFESLTFRNQIRSKVKGVKVYSITQGLLKDLTIWLPPKNEQQKIVKYIEVQTAKIDKAIELQQNYIAKLGEYKASLIDSVVTGKVRVA